MDRTGACVDAHEAAAHSIAKSGFYEQKKDLRASSMDKEFAISRERLVLRQTMWMNSASKQPKSWLELSDGKSIQRSPATEWRKGFGRGSDSLSCRTR